MKLYVEMLSKDITSWFTFVFTETMDLLMQAKMPLCV